MPIPEEDTMTHPVMHAPGNETNTTTSALDSAGKNQVLGSDQLSMEKGGAWPPTVEEKPEEQPLQRQLKGVKFCLVILSIGSCVFLFSLGNRLGRP
jgi:hypothetical protein